jgi:hypothetical protein
VVQRYAYVHDEEGVVEQAPLGDVTFETLAAVRAAIDEIVEMQRIIDRQTS